MDDSALTLDIVSTRPPVEDLIATDHYEIMRLGPQADDDTIERVYATLASRFHPDNPATGDIETFLRIRAAYDVLSDPAKRHQYNLLWERLKLSARFRLRGREFFDGVMGEQNRRLAALCLLYRQRISSYEAPGLTLLDLQQLTGCTREELGSSLWYLTERKLAAFGGTEYCITADGFDMVENKLKDRWEFLAFATIRYYPHPAEFALENSGSSTARAATDQSALTSAA
jgi:DnaJ domain